MTPDAKLGARLAFLARVATKEAALLRLTDERLFAVPFEPRDVIRLDEDPTLAERVEAFVGRFGRLQDTLGDKFLPALLLVVGERPAAFVDNMDRAERLGWVASVDEWLAMRQLRNQMVHEYIEDPIVLAAALNGGHRFVPRLIEAAQRFAEEALRRGAGDVRT